MLYGRIFDSFRLEIIFHRDDDKIKTCERIWEHLRDIPVEFIGTLAQKVEITSHGQRENKSLL